MTYSFSDLLAGGAQETFAGGAQTTVSSRVNVPFADAEADPRLPVVAFFDDLLTGYNAITPRPTSFTVVRNTATVQIAGQSVIRDTYTITVNRVATPGDLIDDPVATP